MRSTTIDHETGKPIVTADELLGVRRARMMAFVIDYLIILVLSIPFAIVIAILGVITLGLGWALYGILLPAVALVYFAKTLGSPEQATIGMRHMGVQLKRLDGAPIDPLLAVVHAVLFWFIHTLALILPLFVSLFSSKKRLLHDILLGTYVARSPLNLRN